MRVIRIRKPETIANPAIRALILRAIKAVNYFGATPERMYQELAATVSDKNVGVFVGVQDERARAIAIGMLPATQAMMAPQVLLAYNYGSPTLARMVGSRLRDWLAAAGYDHFIALNLRHDDALFMRAFRHVGVPRRIGSLIEIQFGGDHEDKKAQNTENAESAESLGA